MNCVRTMLVGLIVAVLLAPVFMGCADSDRVGASGKLEKGGGVRQTADAPPSSSPLDFFPAQVGMRWKYKITLGGGVDPLRYKETTWPLGEGSVTQQTRGRFLPDAEDATGEGGTFILELHVERSAAKQGPLEYSRGVELVVDRDELGIYEDAQRVFWAIPGVGISDPFVHEVVTYSSSDGPPMGSWGDWGHGDGYSMRVILFGERPGIAISQSKSAEQLLFKGVERYKGWQCLRFTRIIESDADEDRGDLMAAVDDSREQLRALSRGFVEDAWFAQDKGLVRLEQRVGDKVSMTWEMLSFTPAGYSGGG